MQHMSALRLGDSLFPTKYSIGGSAKIVWVFPHSSHMGDDQPFVKASAPIPGKDEVRSMGAESLLRDKCIAWNNPEEQTVANVGAFLYPLLENP